MKDGDVVLATLPQADGSIKARPALVLCRVPPFEDLLICGISTQMQNSAPELDEPITPADPDFKTSGLKATSLIRVGYLTTLPPGDLMGSIGRISAARLKRLRTKLATFVAR
jgi:mRNA interferase MazF